MSKQSYFLSVSYYKKNTPEKMFWLSEYHFSEASANKAVQRLEFLGYTIEKSQVKYEIKNYSNVS